MKSHTPGAGSQRFNCTFMELKSDKEELAKAGAKVLIVPLWN